MMRIPQLISNFKRKKILEINLHKGNNFIILTWKYCIYLEDEKIIHCIYLLDDDKASFNDQITRKIGKWKKGENTNVVLFKGPSMIKLEL